MTVFQFEQNNSAKKYIRRCNADGLAVTRRVAKRHRGAKTTDPEIIGFYIPFGGVFISFDRKMLEEHEMELPAESPGIIVIAHSPAMRRTLTQETAEKIIANFKARLPDWHQLPWTNSVVKITDQSVEVFHKEDHGLEQDCYAEWQEGNCDTVVRLCLYANAMTEGE